MAETLARQHSGAIWYGALSLGVVGLTAIAQRAEPPLFQRLIGEATPVPVALAACVLGAVLLSVLVVRHGFSVAGSNVWGGIRRSVTLAALLGVVAIVADVAIVHAADMNVPFPESLVFYPVIALMAEVLFHLLPLCLLLSVMPAVIGDRTPNRALWVSMILVAVIEPAFQVWTAASGAPVVGAPHTYGTWALVYDGLQVLVINLSQLVVFKRYDFVSMYALRLTYYGIWHIAWGYLRLEALF